MSHKVCLGGYGAQHIGHSRGGVGGGHDGAAGNTCTVNGGRNADDDAATDAATGATEALELATNT